MNDVRDIAALVGRLLLALMFVVSGVEKIGAFVNTSVYMASAGLPAVKALLVLTIVVELGGGSAIAFGWRTRWAALVVLFFTAVVTLVFHRFWSVPPDQAMVEQLMFMKNVAVMGGLLVLFAFGPGSHALDHERMRMNDSA